MNYTYEPKEWTNIWWDEADKEENLPRILLVGDSQTYGFYPDVIREMEKDARITAYATSKHIDNPALMAEMDHIAGQFEMKYDLIHFNNGLHGIHQTDAEAFAEDYEKAILHMLKQYPDTKITLALSPPCFQGEDLSEPHEPWFRMAKERNDKVVALGEKYGLAVDDLFTPMLEHPKMHVPDGIHYFEEGRALLGKMVADFIRENLK